MVDQHSAGLAASHLLPRELMDEVIASIEEGEALCCLARPGAGGQALLADIARQACQNRRVVRCSLAQCHDIADFVARLSQQAMQAGVPDAGEACGLTTAGEGQALHDGTVFALLRAKLATTSWRQALPALLEKLAASPTMLLLDGLSQFFLNLHGGVAAGQDSIRRTEWRILMSMLIEGASERLGLVFSATPGIETLFKAHSLSDTLDMCNVLPLGLPNSEAPLAKDAAADYLQTHAAAAGVALEDGAAMAIVEAVGTGFPEHLALALEHAAALAVASRPQSDTTAATGAQGLLVMTPELVTDTLVPRLIGPFACTRFRAQETMFFQGVPEAHQPLLLDLLFRNAAGSLSFEDCLQLAGMGSAHTFMPISMLRLYLEWLEQEGFFVRKGSFYMLPASLFGQWLAARYGCQCAQQTSGA